MCEEVPDTPIQLEGHILLADPSLREGLFHKSVILLAEHNRDEGACGFILNRPTDQTVGDLLTSNEFAPLKNIRVHLGGPVGQEHLTFAALWAKDHHLHFATRISAKNAIIRPQQPGTLVRAFAGYSGWTSGQLEHELQKKSWITTLPEERILQSEHAQKLWAEMLCHISPYHKILAEAPDDIFAN